MNRNEKDFENIVSRLNIDDSPDDAHRQNLRRRMLSVFNEKSSRRAITFQTIAGTIIKSRLAKLAAAAVIIITIGLFLVEHHPPEQPENRTETQVAKSPVEMLTVVSLNIAYRKGGIEAVEKQCDKTLEVLGPFDNGRIRIKDLLVQFEENNFERTNYEN